MIVTSVPGGGPCLIPDLARDWRKLAAISQQSGCSIPYVIDIMGHSIDRQQIVHHLTF